MMKIMWYDRELWNSYKNYLARNYSLLLGKLKITFNTLNWISRGKNDKALTLMLNDSCVLQFFPVIFRWSLDVNKFWRSYNTKVTLICHPKWTVSNPSCNFLLAWRHSYCSLYIHSYISASHTHTHTLFLPLCLMAASVWRLHANTILQKTNLLVVNQKPHFFSPYLSRSDLFLWLRGSSLLICVRIYFQGKQKDRMK